MVRFVLSVFLILLALSGCAKSTESESGNAEPVVGDSAGSVGEVGSDVADHAIPDHAAPENAIPGDLAPDDPIPEDNGADTAPELPPEALAELGVAEALIAAMKSRDADQLIPLLNDTFTHDASIRMDRELAEIVIKGFETNFDLDTLAVELQSWNLEYKSFEFQLSDSRTGTRTGPWSDDERLVFWYQEDGTRIVYNPYVRYFPYADEMVSRYMELIESEDAEGLAAFLNPDDLEVPVWVAEETISQYKRFLKGDRPTVRYLNRFFFAVNNGQGEEHRIEVVHGDGLMGIRDAFIPEF